jgi:hypothetical protein
LKGLPNVGAVNLVGLGTGGLWCLLARGLAGDAIQNLVVDAGGFDTNSDEAFLKVIPQPLIRRAGDFRTAAALAAPAKLFVHRTRDEFNAAEWIAEIYRQLRAANNIKVKTEAASDNEILNWLAAGKGGR